MPANSSDSQPEHQITTVTHSRTRQSTSSSKKRRQIHYCEAEFEATAHYRADGSIIEEHPIHRCQDDVLRIIFEHCSDQSPKAKYPLRGVPRVSNALSLVCLQWRMIALSTPYLWRVIGVRLDRDPTSIQLFWERMVARVKHVPAFITIRECEELTALINPDEPPINSLLSPRTRDKLDIIDWPDPPDVARTKLKMALEGIRLDRIDHIASLTIVFTHGLYLDLLGTSSFRPPIRVCEELVIRVLLPAINEDGDLARQQHFTLSAVAVKFPPMRSLTLECLHEDFLSLEHDPPLATVQRLCLEKLEEIPILNLLQRLSNLSVLFIHRVSISAGVEMAERVEMSHLRRLHIGNVNGLWWLDNLDCPQLCEFVLLNPPSESLFYEFLGRHRSIISLSVPIGDLGWHKLETRLVELTPRLTKVIIRYGSQTKWFRAARWDDIGLAHGNIVWQIKDGKELTYPDCEEDFDLR